MVLTSTWKMAFKRFPQDQRTKVSPTALRMWKWVNRLPSRPSLCFHWSPSSWLIIERMCVNITSWTFGRYIFEHTYMHYFRTCTRQATLSNCQITLTAENTQLRVWVCGHTARPDICHVMWVLLTNLFLQLFLDLEKHEWQVKKPKPHT